MRPAIIVHAITQWVEEARGYVRAVIESEAMETALEKRLFETRDEVLRHRIEAGAFLNKVRNQMPRRGTKENGWKAFLEAIEVDDSTAHRWMDLADPQRLTMRSSGDSAGDRPDAPPPTDADGPPDGEVESQLETVARGARDSWCTPPWLADLLPEVDLDPCSNPRSLIRAKNTYSLEANQDGLALPWFGLVYCNGPFSKLEPWTDKLEAELANVTGAGFMVNTEHSPQWWRNLIRHLDLRLDFAERLEFLAPPGIESSKNDRPQTLLMNETFLAACSPELLKHGTLWTISNR